MWIYWRGYGSGVRGACPCTAPPGKTYVKNIYILRFNAAVTSETGEKISFVNLKTEIARSKFWCNISLILGPALLLQTDIVPGLPRVQSSG